MRLKYALTGSVKFRHHGINEFSNFACGKEALHPGFELLSQQTVSSSYLGMFCSGPTCQPCIFFTCNSNTTSTCVQQLYCV